MKTKKKKNSFFKKNLHIFISFVCGIVISGFTAYATTSYMVNSKEVKYDNSTSGLASTNVQDAIVELNNNATDYSTMLNRLNNIGKEIYPVGSIYISVSNVNPGTLFGGTWVSFGSGKSIVGVNTSDSDFNTVEKTGGSKTKTIAVTNLPAHTHSIPALSGTAASAGGHTHTLTPSGTVSSTFTGTQRSTTSNGAHTHKIITTNTSAAQTYSEKVTDYSGGLVATGEANVIVAPPYYRHPISNGMYNDGGHSHTYTPAGTVSSTFSGSKGTTSSDGAHTHTVSTTASTSGSTGSGTALSTMDPYITVYMWKRTA